MPLKSEFIIECFWHFVIYLIVFLGYRCSCFIKYYIFWISTLEAWHWLMSLISLSISLSLSFFSVNLGMTYCFFVLKSKEYPLLHSSWLLFYFFFIIVQSWSSIVPDKLDIYHWVFVYHISLTRILVLHHQAYLEEKLLISTLNYNNEPTCTTSSTEVFL